MFKKMIEEYIKADDTKRSHMYLHYREMRRLFDYIETADRFEHRNNNGVFAVFFEKMQKTMHEIVRGINFQGSS